MTEHSKDICHRLDCVKENSIPSGLTAKHGLYFDLLRSELRTGPHVELANNSRGYPMGYVFFSDTDGFRAYVKTVIVASKVVARDYIFGMAVGDIVKEIATMMGLPAHGRHCLMLYLSAVLNRWDMDRLSESLIWWFSADRPLLQEACRAALATPLPDSDHPDVLKLISVLTMFDLDSISFTKAFCSGSSVTEAATALSMLSWHSAMYSERVARHATLTARYGLAAVGWAEVYPYSTVYYDEEAMGLRCLCESMGAVCYHQCFRAVSHKDMQHALAFAFFFGDARVKALSTNMRVTHSGRAVRATHYEPSLHREGGLPLDSPDKHHLRACQTLGKSCDGVEAELPIVRD